MQDLCSVQFAKTVQSDLHSGRTRFVSCPRHRRCSLRFLSDLCMTAFFSDLQNSLFFGISSFEAIEIRLPNCGSQSTWGSSNPLGNSSKWTAKTFRNAQSMHKHLLCVNPVAISVTSFTSTVQIWDVTCIFIEINFLTCRSGQYCIRILPASGATYMQCDLALSLVSKQCYNSISEVQTEPIRWTNLELPQTNYLTRTWITYFIIQKE
jgi:hypothetical protein